MAIIIPDGANRAAAADPSRRSELRFLDQLKSLPSDWYVVYGATWIRTDVPSGPREGEIDYVVIGHDIGIVCLELKGGGISCNNGNWASTDRNGRTHAIKNPFDQVQRSKYFLLSHLRDQLSYPSFLPVSHGVVLPDVAHLDVPTLSEAPRDIMILYEDIRSDLQGSIERVAHTFLDRPRLIGVSAQSIAHAIKPQFASRSRWSVQAAQALPYLDALTESQSIVLSSLSHNLRVGLAGPAGSGKTIIALRWIRDQIQAGKRILLLGPGSLLTEYYRSMIPNAPSHYIADSRHLSRSGHLDSEQHSESWDAIVVDEAQDMRLDGWATIEPLAEALNARIICLYDDNQKLYTKDSFYLPSGLITARLNKILRNTRTIAKFSLAHSMPLTLPLTC